MRTGLLPLFGTALAWSFSGVFSKLNGQSGSLIAGVVALIALLVYLLILRPTIKISWLTVLAGISLACVNITFVYANKLTSVGNAIVLQYCSTAFVAAFESIEHKRLPPLVQGAVILLTLTGMVLFFFDEISFEGAIGNILAIVSGMFFGLVFYLNAKPGSSPATSAMIAYVVLAVPLLFMLDEMPQVKPHEWALMAGSGLICEVTANVCFARGIIHVPAFTANLICMSEVILAPLWAALIFGEGFGRFALVGAVLIIGGIVLELVAEREKPAPLPEADTAS